MPQTPAAQTPPQISPVPPASGTAAGSLRTVPACELITREEMSGLLGAPIGRPAAEDSARKTSCIYPPGEAGSYAQAEVTIDWHHSGGVTFERQLADAFGGTAVGRQVARRVELGDEAAYNGGVLTVKLGTALITVALPMRPRSQEQALAIGQKIVEGLGEDSRTRARSASVESSAPDADGPLAILSALGQLFEDDVTEEEVEKKADRKVSPGFPDGLSVDGECPTAPVVAALNEAESSTIPLKEGLTLSSIWVSEGVDFEHECLVQVTAVTPSYIDVTQACSNPDTRNTRADTRRLCRSDLREGFFYATKMYSVALPPVIRGATMFSLSQRSLRELKTAGKTRHRFISVADAWRTSAEPIQTDSDGILSTGPSDRGPYPVIVNDRVADLPTLLAVGHSGTEDQAMVRVLDSDEFPLVIDYHRPRWGFRVHYTKISFPTGGEMEERLATEKQVDLYGLYFDFGSDRLRAESDPVLKEIAGVLAKNAAWTLTINGHTDNIGGEALNLDLSRRRSQSVRRALSERHKVDPARLTTAGFGASQPKEDNSTIEGRAKNRRVELVRR
jgi:outer membrane protein OmpA-like peptidoglycan-associated protein